MPVDLLALSAAFLAGLAGSVHCVAMCGGIATGLGLSTAGGAALPGAVQLNFARVAGYVLAGALVGALGSGLLHVVDVHALQVGVRVGLGIAMMLVALRIAGAGDRWNVLARVAAPAWRALAPLRARLWPADSAAKRIALGMLWGWLPCGLSSSLLVISWLQADAVNGALVMAAFGAGTLPAMLPLTWSGSRGGARLRSEHRRLVAAWIFLAGAITAAAPWLIQVPALHAALRALGCLPAG